MQKIKITIILIFIHNLTFCQKVNLDSLKKISFSESEDTTKAKILYNIAQVYSDQNLRDSSMIYVEKSLTLSKKINYKKGEAQACNAIGKLHRLSGNLSEAIKSHEASIKAYEQIGNLQGVASAINFIGSIQMLTGNYNEALTSFLKVLTIKTELKDELGVAYINNNIGMYYNAIGNTNEALKYFTLSLKQKEALGENKLVGSYSNVGLMYKIKEEYATAFEYYLKAISLAEKTNSKKELSAVYNNIGAIYRIHGNYVAALEYHTKARKICEEINDNANLGVSLSHIAVTHLILKNYDYAEECLLKSLKICEEMGNKPGKINILNSLGVVKNAKGQAQKKPDSIEIRKKYLNEAIDYQHKALQVTLEVGTHENISLQYVNLGISYLTVKNYDLAKKYSFKCLNELKQHHSDQYYDLANRTLYIVHFTTGQLDSAYFYLSRLTDNTVKELNDNYFFLSENEKVLYYSSVEQNFGKYFDFSFLHADKFPFVADTAYNLALLNKNFALKSSTLMRQSILNSGDSLLIQNYENWLSLKNQLSKIYSKNDESDKIEKEVNQIEKELVKKSKSFSDFNQIRSFNWKTVQASLKQNEAAIEFIHYLSELDSLSPIKYGACLILKKSKHPILIPLCNESDIESIIHKIQANNQSYVNTVYGTSNELNDSLYKLIWRPIEKYLKGIKNIYYSPSGLLHKISFAAISQKKNYYLCDQYHLLHQGSTGNIINYSSYGLSENDSYLVLGGINYNTNDSTEKIWSYLPGTLDEVRQIKSGLENKKYRVELFSESEATEQILKNKIMLANVVHIASHGFFFPDPGLIDEQKDQNDISVNEIQFRGSTNYANWNFINNKNPLMRSGIVLANANDVWNRDPLAEGEDGILTAFEVSGLNLTQTKLVVLSACETGLGDIKGSEGVFGLQRAFKMAGAQFLIMSLWQVPDKETEEFMISLYEELDKTKEIRKAFTNAQKAMRKKYDPYFWAAFVLIE